MADATRTGKAIMFDAITDTYAGQIVSVAGISFQGTGLTATNRLLLTDDAGDPVADYLVESATDNADLWGGRQPQFYQGLKIDAGSMAGGGTWALTVFTE